MKSVLEQAEGRFLNIPVPAGCRAYNAGVADFEGRRIIAYRIEDEKLRSVIRIAEIVGDGITNDQPLALPPTAAGGQSMEDPRLFHHDGDLWIAWTSASYSPSDWTCQQCHGRLLSKGGKWRVEKTNVVRFGKNDGTAREKNWQFFTSFGGLYAQYAPNHIIEIDGERVVGEWKEKPVAWRWGKPSGGTPPEPYAPGQLITFFHAFDFDEKHARRYNFAALVFEDRPPFRRVGYSIVPLVIASEADPLPNLKIWQPLCIFPCGTVDDGNVWTVSAGVNDHSVALLSIPKTRLLLDTFDRRKIPAQVTVEVIEPIVHKGDILMPPATPTLKRGEAIQLLDRRKIILIPQPA